MVELPTGTVTFLFTDVEGSTRLLDELGAEQYAEALAGHRRLLRETFVVHGGVEVDTQGDAFFVAFATAPAAMAAAREGQVSLSEGPIRVRMGLHTGTPALHEGGYIGMDVHRAARIAAAAHGGQVVVSATTAALVTGDGLRDLGEHRFKDLAAPERVWQLGHAEFPPLKSLGRTNLPVPATPFLGRDEELAAVAELLTRPDVRY
jgi:class 3 adenylate cyclase